MRKIVLALMAVGLFGAMPAFADDQSEMMIQEEGVRECALKAETLQQKIKRLETEIAKGQKKYDANEINKLKANLDDAHKILDQLNSP